MADIIINIQGQADAAVSSIDQVINRLNTLSSTLNSVAQQAQSTFASIGNIQPQGMLGFQMALNGLSQQLTDLQNQIGNTASQIGDLGQQLNSATGLMGATRTEVTETSSSFVSLGNSASKASGFVGKLFKSIGRIAFYRLLRTVLKEITKAFSEGLKAAYAFSKQTGGMLAPALDAISSASAKMKNQMGAALGGLLTAIAPILLKIIDLATRAAAAITMLFSILNGGGYWKQATDQVSAFGDAAGGAGGKVKGLLAAWDELNVIGNESGGGGGGGSNPLDGAFEWVPVEDILSKFEPIMKIVEKIEKFIKRIVESTKEFIDNLNLEPLYNAAVGFLESIGQLVDAVLGPVADLYEDVLLPLAKWYIEDAAPKSIEVLSAAISFLASVIKPVFDGIHNMIVIMQPIIEWIEGKVVAALDLVKGIFEKLAKVFEEKGPKITQIFEDIGTLFVTVWQIAEPIFTRIWKMIENVVNTVGDIIATVAGFIIDYLSGILEFIVGVFTGDWSRAWEGIKSIFSGAWEAIKSIFSSVFGFIWDQLTTIAPGLKGIVDSAWNAIKTPILTAALWIIENIIEPVALFFANAIDSVTYAIRVAIFKVKQFFAPIVNWIIENVINPIIDVINEVGPVVAYVLGTTWTDIEKIGTIAVESFDTVAEKSTEASDAVREAFKGTKEFLNKELSANPVIKYHYENAPTGVGVNNASQLTTVSAYAEGGYVSTGELFVAREAGPELVGSIGSHTAVANNDQIVAGISSGVQSANSEQNELLRQQNGILLKLLDKQLTISPSAALGQVVARSSALYARN